MTPMSISSESYNSFGENGRHHKLTVEDLTSSSLTPRDISHVMMSENIAVSTSAASSSSSRYKIPTPFKMPTSSCANDIKDENNKHDDYSDRLIPSVSSTSSTTPISTSSSLRKVPARFSSNLLSIPSPPHVKNLFVAERCSIHPIVYLTITIDISLLSIAFCCSCFSYTFIHVFACCLLYAHDIILILHKY